ncbi:MAG: universal stress protein [Deltaproteobacteria bacterium]|nr:universal stress protein [Deltaproteobacteria bacterium]
MGIARVVAATDFSPEADLALTHAVAIAQRHGAALTLVFAEPDAPPEKDTSRSATAEQFAAMAAAEIAEAQRQLARRAEDLRARAPGLVIETVLRPGAPDEVIADVAAELGAQLTVVGTHDHHGLRHFFRGSVAERVVKRTPEWSLVARGPAPPAGAFARVLVATDFSDAAQAALRAAIALVAPDGVLDVVHAWQHPLGLWSSVIEKVGAFAALRDAIIAKASAGAKQVTDDAAALGRTIAVELRQGVPGTTISHVAASGNYDLVAVGTHGHRGMRRLLLGSVAEGVVRSTACSVLVAHAPPRA